MNDRDHLKKIKEGENLLLVEFNYDGDERNISRKYANNTSAEYGYNPNGQITNLKHNPSGFVNTSYTYDKEGNPLAANFGHNPSNSEHYDYDRLGQLTGFKKGNANQSVFIYDGVGNRTKAQINGVNASYSVTNMNAYNSVVYGGELNLKYDLNGNLVNDGKNIYTYDHENRIIAVNDGKTSAYNYDALGRRIQKTKGDKIINYFFDGQQVIEERNEKDAIEATYVWGTWVDDIVSMSRNGNSYYYHTNTVGSVTSVTDGSGKTVERYEYDAFGNVSFYNENFSQLAGSGINNSYMFTGRQYEAETGLYFYRTRYYDPRHGRFLQRDPLDYEDGMGLYTYVSNRPSFLIDPLGLQGDPCQSTWSNFNSALDKFQTGLDIIGLIPGFGEPFDLLNSGIFLLRGQYGNALISIAAMAPIAGWMAPSARNIVKYSPEYIKLANFQRKQWIRFIHESYSQTGGFETWGIAWGASKKYINTIENKTLRSWNSALREFKLPGKQSWWNEPGHLHLWKRKK